jgi:hypothetical protein
MPQRTSPSIDTRPDFSKLTVEQFIAWSEAERHRLAMACAGKTPRTQEQFDAIMRARWAR